MSKAAKKGAYRANTPHPERNASNGILYKYRGLENLGNTLDILVNGRMFAAHFENLNDPMEGSYIYTARELTRDAVRRIYDDKTRIRILSLSATPTNMLMWSYYAESHTGVVLGVRVRDPKAILREVRYVENLEVTEDHPHLAWQILCRKLQLWSHEQERRAFIRESHGPFIRVEVREVIFGVGTSQERKALVTAIAKKFCQKATIRTLRRNELATSPLGVRRLDRELTQLAARTRGGDR